MRQWARTIGAGLFIVAAGAVVLLKQQRDNRPPTLYEPLLKCRACGEEFRAELTVVALPPFRCTHCGRKDAWNLWRCNQCGSSFLPAISGEPPRPEAVPQCPDCQSKSTGRL